METTTFIIILAIIYGVLLFFDTFFRTCSLYPYIQFLKAFGLKVNLFSLNWETKFFNRIIVRWGNTFSKFFTTWFTIGFYITLAILPFAIILLLIATIQIFTTQNNTSKSVSLEPAIPGVNLPTSELGYYVISMLICSLFHELGHALAAVNEDVHVEGFGFYLLFMIPVAYVNLNSEKLYKIAPRKCLTIFCAGVWHNVVLAIFAYILYAYLPQIFSLFYYVNNGVIVTNVKENSLISGAKGLHDGDIITKLNDCVIKSTDDWNGCLLLKMEEENKVGFCVDSDFIYSSDESVLTYYDKFGVINCCNSKKTDYLCFEYLEPKNGAMEMPQYICLPARKIAEKYDVYCTKKIHCPSKFHCVQPVLSNSTFLFNFRRLSESNVIYLGHYYDIIQNVQVSSFIPRLFFESANFPTISIKLMLYLTVFSLGLSLVNLIPCYFMDGQHILRILLQMLLPKTLNKNDVSVIIFLITLFGTFLFCLNVAINVYNLLF